MAVAMVQGVVAAEAMGQGDIKVCVYLWLQVDS